MSQGYWVMSAKFNPRFCGPWTNVFEQKGYLNQICHLHPDTYNRLLDFAQRWKTDPEVKAFFHQECTFSNGQLARFEKDLLAAAATMQSRRAAGKLLLDLDLDDFFKPGQ
jgi:hypothetical protein